MRFDRTILSVLGILSIAVLSGCSSVTFIPVDDADPLPAKPSDFDVQVLEWDRAGSFRIIGTISCQDSATSSIWNWWTDNQALITGMQQDNLDRLLSKVRKVGGEALIDLKHDISVGGSSGGLGVGAGVGVGNSPVGIGVGTSILGGNPKVIVTSYGSVGVSKGSGDE